MALTAEASGPEISLVALGVPTVIRVHGSRSDELAGVVATAWSRCIALDSGESAALAVDVCLDDDPTVVSAGIRAGWVAGNELAAVMDALSPAVTMTAITHRQDDLLMLHAAGLAYPDTGATVLLVGPSGAGKTTAVCRLARDLGYLTDETVGIDALGGLVAYPKPLSVITGSSPYKEQVSPDSLGLLPHPAQPALAGVVLLDRIGTASTPVVSDVPKLEALARLAEQSSFLRRHERPLHRLAEVVDQVGGVRRVQYSDASDLAAPLRALMVA